METVILKIQRTVKTLADNLIDLMFAPILTVYNIVNQSINVWKQQEEEEPGEPEQTTNVTQYPSVNEGNIGTFIYPMCKRKRIGYRNYD